MARKSLGRSAAVSGVVAGLQVVFATAALAVPVGQLDPAFNGGKVTYTFGSTATGSGVVLQAGGKVVVTGTSQSKFALVRYLSNGTVDNTFGTSGGTTLTALTSAMVAYGASADANGNILVVGQTKDDFIVARYTANGILDPSFAGSGLVLTDFNGAYDTANAVAVDSTGRIVVAGTSGADVAIARYMPNGALDPFFGASGKVTTDLVAGSTDAGYDVAVQKNDYVVVAGSTSPYSGDAALVRYRTNGSLDPAFGGTGIVTTNFGGGSDRYYAVLVQKDGKIVGGGTTSPWAGDFILGRYSTAGAPDATFGSSGKVSTNIGGPGDGIYDLAQDADRLVAIGTTDPFYTGDFAVARYGPTGALDSSFNFPFGANTTDIGASTRDLASAAAVDGGACSLVVAGRASATLAAARYRLC